MKNCSTMVSFLQYRALSQSQKTAFTFLEDGETETETLTYGELDRRAKAIAARLQMLDLRGERALLLYPSGLDYLAAFFGCLYAGVIAVPAYPPQNQRKTPRIQAIAADAEAKIVLTIDTLLFRMESLFSKTENKSNLQWLATDNLESGIEDTWQELNLEKDTIAFLQYTSGSTGTPKGVMVSHGNLLHNAAMTYHWMRHSPESKFVSWLPIYHDMGLIGGILQPLYGCFPCYLMPPVSFLQRPYRWLQAISRYGGTTSGAPNFAYELCLQKITAEQKASLDLRSWQVAFNGAEPILSETLERFSDTFAECGFRADAFYPCYGMAEATLLVSGEDRETGRVEKTGYQTKAVDRSALAKDCIVEVSEEEDSQIFVGCGKSIPGQEIAIANPQTMTLCEPNCVGEIWVRGDSIARGYWHRREETEETFQACLADDKENYFLRTGDLGFLNEKGELFVTGRLKDLIIIRGRNLYPQDIELTAERSHDALRLGSNAAFTVEKNNQEKLVIVQELEFRAKPNLEEVIIAIRQAVTEVHEIEVYGVVLIKPGRIPKTSSGKIQRRATRHQFLSGSLDIVASNILETRDFIGAETELTRKELLALPPQQSQLLLESYLRAHIARILKRLPQEINLTSPLTSLGLDSLKVFELKNRIENDLVVNMAVADLFSELTIRSLATKLLAKLEANKAENLEKRLRGEHQSDTQQILRVSRETALPLSFNQRRLWFLDRLEPNSLAYNFTNALFMKGILKVGALENSINEIVRRHEVLRTHFEASEGQPIQKIASVLNIPLPIVDLQNLPETERKAELKRIEQADARQPFNMAQAPLLRLTLVRLKTTEHILLITMHHIIFDAWSAEILIQELSSLYRAFSQGLPTPLTELPVQYADYAVWQQHSLKPEVLQTQLAYWKKQLEGAKTILELPTDKPRSQLQTSVGKKHYFELSKELTYSLKILGQQQEVTLFMTLLAAFNTLLYHYTKQEDILIGSPIANRNCIEIEGLIGFFANTIVLRTNLSKNPSFKELLQQVRKVALGAYTYQDLPFEKLVTELQVERSSNRSPLFQVWFVLQNAFASNLELEGLDLNIIDIESGMVRHDLNLNLSETSKVIKGFFEYKTDLFEATTITQMVKLFETLLEIVVKQPNIHLQQLTEILNKFQKEQQIIANQEFKKARSQKLVKIYRKKFTGIK